MLSIIVGNLKFLQFPFLQLHISISILPQVIQMFHGCKQEDMPPHIYASAQTTYRNMLATNSDQSLVLTGPSGSGKSVNCAHLLHYFCSTSVSPHSSLIGKL